MRGIVAALLFFLSAAFAFNNTVAEGTEVFVTNPGGSVIWGYGVVRNGVFELSMSRSAGELVLIAMSARGEVKAWPGRLVGGELDLVFEGGEHVNLAELLTTLSLQLSVRQLEPGQAPARPTGTGRGDSLPAGENGKGRMTASSSKEAESGENAGAD